MYMYNVGVVFFISTLSVLISLFQTRRHRKQLHDMVISSSRVTVYRDGKGEARHTCTCCLCQWWCVYCNVQYKIHVHI